MPKEYGIKATGEGMLTWEHVNEALKSALNYWIATTSHDGRPHVRPVWAAWVDNILYFDGHPATGWGRNINRDPRISVQVEAGEDAIIVEGIVVDIPQAPAGLAERLAVEFDNKYKSKYGHTSDPEPWKERGLFSLHPQKILAWNVVQFSASPTRWQFETGLGR
jgi:hypothetical protein